MKTRATYVIVILLAFSCNKEEVKKQVRCSFTFVDQSYQAKSANCSAEYSWYYAARDYLVGASGENFSISFTERDMVSLNGSESLYSRSIMLWLADTDTRYSYWGTDAFVRGGTSVSFNVELSEFESGEPGGLLTGYCACSSGNLRRN